MAFTPDYSVEQGVVSIKNVSSDCPIIYDNDWWKDVPDAAYLWAKASLGQANLRGNIVSRDMWNWEGGYTYQLAQSMEDAQTLLQTAQASGLRNIPAPIAGASEAMRRPSSDVIEDTAFTHSPGSELILKEARQATPEKPLLVFIGGPCTTVATAYLADPSIADRMIVFQIDGGAYNGKESWSWHIVEQRCLFANWARGYFWGEWSHWQPSDFDIMSTSPLELMLKQYANSDLGKANQWGDGAWIFALFSPQCITQCEEYEGVAITVPRDGTNVAAIKAEFFRTFGDARLFSKAD